MVCKKCKKEIPEKSLFCNLCGAPQRKNPKKKMYQRPDGLYEKIVVIGGKRVPFRGKTEAEVMRKMVEYTEKAEIGRTFSEVATEWHEKHWKTIEYNTTKCYDSAYRRAMDYFGEIPVKAITSNQVNNFIIEFARQGYAQKTVRTQLLIIHMALEYAALNGDIEYNPTNCISPPKNLPKKKRDIPDAKYIKIVKESTQNTFGLFAYFLLFTGCRRGEALAIQYKDIDLTKKVITINKSVYHISNQPYIKKPKTEAGVREVILLDCLAKCIPSGKPNNYLFQNESGGLLTASQFRRKWKLYCKESGFLEENANGAIIYNVTPHQLRHAYATILFEAGVDEKDAQELLGHANISMTKDVYTHITGNRKEKTAQQLNSYNNKNNS